MFRSEDISRLVDSGDHWKAKEKLQGKMVEPGYDSELFEQYGMVLLAMHDKLEAGKYLFLSGVRDEAYLEPINLYLQRYAGKGSSHIQSTFPKKIQNTHFSEFPETVKAELAELEFTPKKIDKNIQNNPYRKTLSDRVAGIGCVVLLVFVGIVFVIGLGVILSTIWRWTT